MNERIRQLADEADKCAWAGGNWFEADFRAKFAELIVRECIKAVDNSGGDNAEYHMDSIKKHFGVEL
jgi:hypothetical protein